MSHLFTTEQLQELAAIERAMDDGTQPFVMNGGFRMAVMPEVMSELNLRSGQSINPVLVVAILERQLAVIKARAAIDKAATK